MRKFDIWAYFGITATLLIFIFQSKWPPGVLVDAAISTIVLLTFMLLARVSKMTSPRVGNLARSYLTLCMITLVTFGFLEMWRHLRMPSLNERVSAEEGLLNAAFTHMEKKPSGAGCYLTEDLARLLRTKILYVTDGGTRSNKFMDTLKFVAPTGISLEQYPEGTSRLGSLPQGVTMLVHRFEEPTLEEVVSFGCLRATGLQLRLKEDPRVDGIILSVALGNY